MSGALGIAAADSELVFSHIAELQFSYYTSAEIARLAVCSVEQATHSDALGHAVRGGLYDARMGVSDFRAQCGTCHLNGAHCPGHLGKIDLLLPAYQPLTFRWLVRLLRFKCFHCNRLRMPHARAVLFLDALDALATGDIFRALALLPLSAQHVLARGFGFQELLGTPDADNAADADALAAAIAAAFEKTTAAAAAAAAGTAGTAGSRKRSSEAAPSLAEAPAGRALAHTNRIINAVRKEIVKLFTAAASAASRLCANCGASNPAIKPDADCVKLFASIHASHEAVNAKRKVRLMPDFSVRDASAPLDDDSAAAAPKLSLALAEQALAKEKSAQKRALIQAAAARAADLRGDNSTKKKRKKKHDEQPADDDDDNDDDDKVAAAAAAAAADDNDNDDDNAAAAPEVPDDKHMYLAPAMVREHLRVLWNQPVEARLLNHVFGGGGDHGGGAAYEIFFLDCLAVPANRFRVMKDEGSSMSSQDVLFTNVLRAQDRMRDALARRGELGDAQFNALIAGLALTVQKSVNDLFDKEADPRKPGPTGVRQVLEKKDGLFRMHIMGKRVNHAARSVISPDVNLATNEIGLPLYFATHLTVPEPVCGYNHERLVRAVINGADEWPGATQVKFDNETVRLDAVAFRADRERRVAIARRLASGTPDAPVVVHRHVLNNDFVLMNRQPTLHRPSIMAHRIRVLNNGDKVLRMHYANCNVYNADFDGDEMNCHRPQDLLASAEAAVIVNADEQYCGPRDGQPARGLIQDHVSSGVLLTQKDTFLTREQFHQLIWAGCQALERDVDLVSERVGGAARLPRVRLPQPAILKPRALWTGKQVVRCVLEQCVPGQPPLTMRCAAKTKAAAWRGHAEEATVVVHQHDLVTGVLDKNQFGASAFGLVHAVFEVYGGAAAGRVLSTLGRLLSTFLQGHGFTCGIADLLLTPKAERERAATLRKADAAGIAAAASFVGLFDDTAAAAAPSGSTDAANVALISRQLRALLSSSAPAAKALDSRMTSTLAKSTSAAIAAVFPSGLLVPFPRNNMTLMTTTGAKGSQVNAAQISGLLGSQELEGRRVPLMASGKSLPCFEAYSPAARAGGYVTDRFLTGIRPQEYYFHCVPEDHEILTERGFMDLDAYERAVAAGESVRVAGYDAAATQMLFEQPLRLVVNAPATQTLIEFSSVHEMLDTWAANCGDYGLVSSAAPQNHMSLLVTPGHMMYVQLATAVQTNERTNELALKETAKRSASGARQKEPHAKHTARSLLAAEGTRHLAVCSEGVRSASDAEFEFVHALALSTTAQIDAFLELYGFFIGDGALLTHANGAICFNQRKRGDVDFLIGACVRAGLERDVDFTMQQTADNRTVVRIVKPTWTAYFAGQYGHKYRAGDDDDDDDDDDNNNNNCRRLDEERRGRTEWTMRELALSTNVPIVAQASSAPTPARVDALGVPYDAVSWAGGSYMAPEKSAKWFWHWVWTLDKARLRRVLAGVGRADGSWSRKETTICTSSARFRDELVRVLLMAGYSARFGAPRHCQARVVGRRIRRARHRRR
jgi:DNA-directed RNA polymerase I subunit RPA1